MNFKRVVGLCGAVVMSAMLCVGCGGSNQKKVASDEASYVRFLKDTIQEPIQSCSKLQKRCNELSAKKELSNEDILALRNDAKAALDDIDKAKSYIDNSSSSARQKQYAINDMNFCRTIANRLLVMDAKEIDQYYLRSYEICLQATTIRPYLHQ